MSSYYDYKPSRSYSTTDREPRSSRYTTRSERRSRENSPEPVKPKPTQRQPSRYSFYPPPSQNSSPPRASTANTTARRIWPPAPKVEDERSSLAKEAYPPKITDSEARSRGSIDQTPILYEVETPKDDGALSNNSRLGNRTSKSSLRNRRQSRVNNEQSRQDFNPGKDSASLEGELPETSMYTRRMAAPYVFTPKAPENSRNSFTDEGYFSSDVRSSQNNLSVGERQEKVKKQAKFADATPREPEPLKGNGKAREHGEGYARSESGIDSRSGDDTSSVGSRDSGRVRAPYSYTKSNFSSKERQPEVRDFAKSEPKARIAEIKANALMTDNTPPRTSSNTRTKDAYSGKSASSYSRPSSPVNPTQTLPPSPPQTPRAELGHNGSTKSARSSVTSTPGSRPVSPTRDSRSSKLDEGLRRSSTFPVVLDERSSRSSRLASDSHAGNTCDPSPRSSIVASMATADTAALPYPIDDMNLMPSEDDHKYKPRALDTSSIPKSVPDDALSDIKKRSSRPISADFSSRPPVNSRHTTANLATLTTLNSGTTVDTPESSPINTKSSATVQERPRARCLKYQTSKDFAEWHYLDGNSNFDVCPKCLDSYFPSSASMKSFKRARRTEHDPKVECAFTSPWTKFAWRLTQDQQRHDLEVMHKLARVSARETACSGDAVDVRSWYTIYDKQGEPLPQFEICTCDMRKIEALLPSLRGTFEKARSSGRKRRCSLRSKSTRFTEYLDLLAEIDAVAASRGRQPDLSSFAELVRHKAEVRECSRDNLATEHQWHVAPQLPEFTVCEECYSTVIWPAIAGGSSVASRFNRTPGLLREDRHQNARPDLRNANMPPGNSCQLYSPRMRRVFKKAVQNADFKYLSDRAKDRKEREMELLAQYLQIQRTAKELVSGKVGDRTSVQIKQKYADLEAQMAEIVNEWRKWE